jgi:hypothetical protein
MKDEGGRSRRGDRTDAEEGRRGDAENKVARVEDPRVTPSPCLRVVLYPLSFLFQVMMNRSHISRLTTK